MARGGGVWLPRQMYSWTLVTLLCVGGSYVPPGTAVYLMDKPRLRAHCLPGHREARLGRSQWTLTLCPWSRALWESDVARWPPGAPASRCPSADPSLPEQPARRLWCGSVSPRPRPFPVPRPTGSLSSWAHTRRSRLPARRVAGAASHQPSRYGPPDPTETQPGQAAQSWALGASRKGPHRWVGARECPKHTHVLRPRPPSPGQGGRHSRGASGSIRC